MLPSHQHCEQRACIDDDETGERRAPAERQELAPCIHAGGMPQAIAEAVDSSRRLPEACTPHVPGPAVDAGAFDCCRRDRSGGGDPGSKCCHFTSIAVIRARFTPDVAVSETSSRTPQARPRGSLNFQVRWVEG